MVNLADIFFGGIDAGSGVVSRAHALNQQEEQLRRLRELDTYQQEQDRLNYGLRQADDARADQRFAFDQERAARQDQQYQQGMGQEQAAQRFNTGRYIQQTGPVGDSNFFQAADFSQMDPRSQSAALAQNHAQMLVDEEKQRKIDAWNRIEEGIRRGGPRSVDFELMREAMLAEDANIPQYAVQERWRRQKAAEAAAQQSAMVAQSASDLQTLYPKAKPGQAEAAARLRANDMPVGLGDANLSGETRGLPITQNPEYQALSLELKDAEDAAEAAKSAYAMVRTKANKAVWDQAMQTVKSVRGSMRTLLRGGGPAPSPTSAVAPAAAVQDAPISQDEVLLFQRLTSELGREPTEAEFEARKQGR